jgi:hypothetical protein
VLQHTEKLQRTETDKREKREGRDLFQVNILSAVYIIERLCLDE